MRDLLHRRTVALGVSARDRRTGAIVAEFCTFTRFTYHRMPILVTCTHVLEHVERVVQELGPTHDIQFAWHDYASTVGQSYIPTTAEIATRASFRFKAEASDMSVLLVPENTQSLLACKDNDSFALADIPSRRHRPSVSRIEGNFVCGFPAERTSVVPSSLPDEVLVIQPFFAIPISADSDTHLSAELGFRGDNHIEAAVRVTSGQLQSMKGTSGGPVVSIARFKDGRTRAMFLGVQSTWIERTRRVSFSPHTTLRQLLAEVWQSYKAWKATNTSPNATMR